MKLFTHFPTYLAYGGIAYHLFYAVSLGINWFLSDGDSLRDQTSTAFVVLYAQGNMMAWMLIIMALSPYFSGKWVRHASSRALGRSAKPWMLYAGYYFFIGGFIGIWVYGLHSIRLFYIPSFKDFGWILTHWHELFSGIYIGLIGFFCINFTLLIIEPAKSMSIFILRLTKIGASLYATFFVALAVGLLGALVIAIGNLKVDLDERPILIIVAVFFNLMMAYNEYHLSRSDEYTKLSQSMDGLLNPVKPKTKSKRNMATAANSINS